MSILDVPGRRYGCMYDSKSTPAKIARARENGSASNYSSCPPFPSRQVCTCASGQQAGRRAGNMPRRQSGRIASICLSGDGDPPHWVRDKTPQPGNREQLRRSLRWNPAAGYSLGNMADPVQPPSGGSFVWLYFEVDMCGWREPGPREGAMKIATNVEITL